MGGVTTHEASIALYCLSLLNELQPPAVCMCVCVNCSLQDRCVDYTKGGDRRCVFTFVILWVSDALMSIHDYMLLSSPYSVFSPFLSLTLSISFPAHLTSLLISLPPSEPTQTHRLHLFILLPFQYTRLSLRLFFLFTTPSLARLHQSFLFLAFCLCTKLPPNYSSCCEAPVPQADCTTVSPII